MAGIHFSFDNFEELLALNVGIAKRLDENRAESFTLLYCDFTGLDDSVIVDSLTEVLRTSDAIVNSGEDYFFVLPYTDKYGAGIVKKMFEDFFAKELQSSVLSYPIDGESAKELLRTMQDEISSTFSKDLYSLDKFTRYQ